MTFRKLWLWPSQPSAAFLHFRPAGAYIIRSGAATIAETMNACPGSSATQGVMVLGAGSCRLHVDMAFAFYGYKNWTLGVVALSARCSVLQQIPESTSSASATWPPYNLLALAIRMVSGAVYACPRPSDRPWLARRRRARHGVAAKKARPDFTVKRLMSESWSPTRRDRETAHLARRPLTEMRGHIVRAAGRSGHVVAIVDLRDITYYEGETTPVTTGFAARRAGEFVLILGRAGAARAPCSTFLNGTIPTRCAVNWWSCRRVRKSVPTPRSRTSRRSRHGVPDPSPDHHTACATSLFRAGKSLPACRRDHGATGRGARYVGLPDAGDLSIFDMSAAEAAGQHRAVLAVRPRLSCWTSDCHLDPAGMAKSSPCSPPERE